MKTTILVKITRSLFVLLLCFTLSIVFFCGCSTQSKTPAQPSNTISSKPSVTSTPPAATSIVGSWVINDSDLESWSWDGEFSSIIDSKMGDTREFPYILTFYDDGTYSFTKGYYWEYAYKGQEGTFFEIKHFPEERFSGSYSIINDGKAIQFSSNASYGFSVKGNTLKLTGENGTIFTYNKE